MNFTIRTVLRIGRMGKDGRYPVAICITYQRQRYYYSTGNKVTDKQFENGLIKGLPNADVLNALISKKVNELQRELLVRQMNDQPVSLSIAKSLLSSDGNTGDFLAYAQKVLDDMAIHRSAGTKRAYTPKFEQVKAFSGGKLSFSEITPGFLNKLYKHLRNEGQHHNTTLNAFKFIRLVFNQAKDEKLVNYYPFSDWKYPKYQETQKQYLTVDELDSLEQLIYHGELPDEYRVAGAFFLVECYAGIRHSDWAKFKVEKLVQNEQLYVTATKTGQRVTIPLSDYPRLKRVIDFIKANNLVYLPNLTRTNEILKNISSMTKPAIDKKIRTHTGRHTCATLLLEQGLSKESIATILGVTVKIVDTYAKITSQKIQTDIQKMRDV